MIRKMVVLCSIVIAVTIAGCSPKCDGTLCYPSAARKWITPAAAPPSTANDPGGAYRIYLDGSGSMGGYIRGAGTDEKPLSDLIGTLPDLPTIDRSDVRLFRFDEGPFTELSPADALATMGVASGYGNKDSHIDRVLQTIADDDEQSLSVVVSDLWLVNGNVVTTGPVALASKLTKIMESGRSIAIYGFQVPYAGKVSDLPSGDQSITATRRHLFLLVAGPIGRLQAFHSAMETISSPAITTYMDSATDSDRSNDTFGYSLFTTQPLRTELGGTQVFTAMRGTTLTKRTFRTARTGVRLPQYVLDKGATLTAENVVPGVRWQGVPESAMRPGAIWAGPSSGTIALFREVGDSGVADGGDWAADGSLNGGWQADGGFTLDPAELATLNSGRYLLVGTLSRTDIISPNPATAWMRDWSFSTATEAQAVTKAVMPTLNLAELARLLEIELQRSVHASPVEFGGFAVAVEVE